MTSIKWVTLLSVGLNFGLAGCGAEVATNGDGLSVSAPVSAIQEGQRVKARLAEIDGKWVAERLEIKDKLPKDPAEAKLKGPLERFDADGGAIVVFGVKALITGETKLKGSVDLASVPPGTLVDLKFTRGADGVLLATSVDVKGPELEANVEAVRETLDGVSVTVLGREILVNGQTDVRVKVPKADKPAKN